VCLIVKSLVCGNENLQIPNDTIGNSLRHLTV